LHQGNLKKNGLSILCKKSSALSLKRFRLNIFFMAFQFIYFNEKYLVLINNHKNL
jgi:hypothetical protein